MVFASCIFSGLVPFMCRRLFWICSRSFHWNNLALLFPAASVRCPASPCLLLVSICFLPSFVWPDYFSFLEAQINKKKTCTDRVPVFFPTSLTPHTHTQLVDGWTFSLQSQGRSGKNIAKHISKNGKKRQKWRTTVEFMRVWVWVCAWVSVCVCVICAPQQQNWWWGRRAFSFFFFFFLHTFNWIASQGSILCISLMIL